MKKVIGLIVLAMMVVLPMTVNAKIIFEESVKGVDGKPGSKDGFYCDEVDQASKTKTCYIVGRTTEGDTISKFTAQLTLQNMSIKSVTANAPWTNNSNGTNLSFEASTNVSGDKFTIATIVFEVNNLAEKCALQFIPCFTENGNYGCGTNVTVTESYVCRIVDGKYYGKNGNEVTEAVYNAECVNNPQTGSSVPYVVIIAGIALAVIVFTVSRKNTKLYKI